MRNPAPFFLLLEGRFVPLFQLAKLQSLLRHAFVVVGTMAMFMAIQSGETGLMSIGHRRIIATTMSVHSVCPISKWARGKFQSEERQLLSIGPHITIRVIRSNPFQLQPRKVHAATVFNSRALWFLTSTLEIILPTIPNRLRVAVDLS